MPTIQEYRDALGTALGLITKHGLAVNLAAKEPEDFARLKAARETAAAPFDATDAAPSAPQTPAPDASALMLAALRAISARVAGRFDDPDLMECGLLGSIGEDIALIAERAIRAAEGREG